MSAVVEHEFRADLRETARGFLRRSGSLASTRPVIEEATRPLELERQIAELGWLGVEVPEEHGGLGGSFGDLAVILHELGRVASPSAFTTTAVLGVGALLTGTHDQQARWLGRVAIGDAIVTAALTGSGGARDRVDIELRDSRLEGVADFVPDLRDADALVVAARGESDADEALFLLSTDTPGLAIEPYATVDRTRRLDRLVLTGVEVTDGQRLQSGGEARRVRDHLLARGALAVACDAVGGCERILEMTVEYLSERRQFGRPIGSFQALKHRAADMLYETEGSRSAVDHAAERIGEADGEVAVSIAKSYAGDAYVHVAEEGVQLHGGIGFTWDHELHLYLKRARLGQLLFGDSAWHREVLASAAMARS